MTPATKLKRFATEQEGAIAVWFGVMALPTLLMVGVGFDVGRALLVRTQLQSAADSAALAGAAAYTSSSTATTAKTTATTYMSNAVSRMIGGGSSIAYTVTTSTSTSSGSTSAYAVTVTATATSTNTLAATLMSSLSIGATATAKNYVYTATITLSSFNSSAYDADTIYYYIVPSDGSVPSSSALTKMYSNTSKNNSGSISVTLTGSQKIGFALLNVTGGITGYGKNGYGGAQGSSHYFYSHLMPPSSQAYSSVTKDCSLQVTTSTSAVKSGSCLTSLPTYASLNCASASGKTLYYSWNDMGGGSDDLDYNDAVYTVACAATDSSATATGVVLTN